MPARTDEDRILRPRHYTFSRYEVLDVLEEWFPQDPWLWMVVRYVARAAHKGDMLGDLSKAHFYLTRRMELLRRASRSRHRGRTRRRSE